MISSSLPEPACDVAAQLRALDDPMHPKDAVWIARGTVMPEIRGAIVLSTADGVLLTTSRQKAELFTADPSDDTLAVILGYVEPKSRLIGPGLVVQARDATDSVVLEMGVSLARMPVAIEIAQRYGDVRVVSLPAALIRRLDLLRLEKP